MFDLIAGAVLGRLEDIADAHWDELAPYSREFLDFLTRRTLPNTQLDPDHTEASGWVLFNTKNKWLGDWKKPEGFLLRFPIADKIVEFPFELPARQGDLILRRRPQ